MFQAADLKAAGEAKFQQLNELSGVVAAPGVAGEAGGAGLGAVAAVGAAAGGAGGGGAGGSASKRKRDGDDVNENECPICLIEYDGRAFMIGCDKCDRWYHGVCVGIDETHGASDEEYVCPRCKAKRAAGKGKAKTGKAAKGKAGAAKGKTAASKGNARKAAAAGAAATAAVAAASAASVIDSGSRRARPDVGSLIGILHEGEWRNATVEKRAKDDTCLVRFVDNKSSAVQVDLKITKWRPVVDGKQLSFAEEVGEMRSVCERLKAHWGDSLTEIDQLTELCRVFEAKSAALPYLEGLVVRLRESYDEQRATQELQVAKFHQQTEQFQQLLAQSDMAEEPQQ